MDASNPPGPTELNRLVHDAPLYTPDMGDGLCLETGGGGTMQISRQGSNILVNGARLVKSDVITRNGVIHYLEKVRPNYSTISVILLSGRLGPACHGMHYLCRLNRNCGHLHDRRF